MEKPIYFFVEDIDFDASNLDTAKVWINQIVDNHGFTLDCLNYIFCSDAYLLHINRTYLAHNYYTDIITFPYHSEDTKALFTDIYISIDRVRENAKVHGEPFKRELHRVMIHGVLHLLGYDDHETEDIKQMRKAEEYALEQLM